MPANLTPDYHRAEEHFRSAKTNEEKVLALEEMLRVVPKHKGTDGLQADLKARLAKLRKQPMSKAARASFSHVVEKEGAGQVALLGPPNSGKSSLVAALTHATPEIAEYPFTTREPVPGMMPFEDVRIQLVDLPPLNDDHVEPWVWDIARRADAVWLVVNVEDGLDGFLHSRERLDEKAIRTTPPGGGGKPALVVATGLDRGDGPDDLEILRELMDPAWPLYGVSTVTRAGLDVLAKRTFEALDVIRVYTKQPGKPADKASPFTLPRGATVADLATRIHNDLAAAMHFARVWGPSVFDGQTVHGEHVLLEGDVVEIH
ncbi:MAG TPA: GTPase [Candidatus Polarisedimenticolaceae bacterium]